MDPFPVPTGPLHPDEIAAQRRAGRAPRMPAIRRLMPEQHREFFATLPCVFLSVIDDAGWPIALMLSAEAGFVRSRDPATLRIERLPDEADPAASCLMPGGAIGVLGIDLATRRRNRANGRIVARDAEGLSIAVEQSFGNCPQYIQRRALSRDAAAPRGVEPVAALDAEARRLIFHADTFFVASVSPQGLGSAGGADISHRGGRPGFVRVAGETLTIPDFRGNFYFNTLGNLLGEPRAGLLFLDFEHGDLLQLQGITEIDWSGEAAHEVAGAERSWRFRVVRGWRRRGASPLRWRFVDFAPTTERTGVWESEDDLPAEADRGATSATACRRAGPGASCG